MLINRYIINGFKVVAAYLHYNLHMLKYLQAESQSYFRNRTYTDAFTAQTTPKQRASFYSMLLVAHLSANSDAVLNYLGQAAATRVLDSGALMSALWGVSLQVSAESDEGKRLTALVGALQARSIVERGVLLTDLPQWVVLAAGLVQAVANQRRTNRVYTKINYEQSKHSLLRENNEGYAKMALLLLNLRDSHDITLTWQRMLDLVGNFDLDPDRVLDLIVEARVHNHATTNYLRLLDNFRRESIAAILGNKLRLCRGKPIQASLFQKLTYAGPLQTIDGEGEAVDQVVSPHLVSLCAELIKRDALDYQDILPYLQPGDHVIRKINTHRVDLALQKVKECFTLNMEELDQTAKAKMAFEENLKFEGQLLHSTKLALMAEMVRLNDWKDFQAAWVPFKDKLDLLLYQPLLRNLLDLVEWVIEPLFQTISYHRFFRNQVPPVSGNASPKEHPRISTLEANGLNLLQTLLSYVGKYVGLRSRLFIKLCRLLRRQAKQGRGQAGKGIIQRQLILGSCVVQNNAAMALQLFQLLDCYDYKFRYACYLRIYNGGMSECPIVARIFQSIKRRQNIIVNNLSKQNKKLFIRKFSKLTHNQALPVFYWIVRRIVMEDYEAVVPEIVAVICNCSPLTLDMVIFVMLYTLNESKQPPVNAKTHECLPWFKNVTTFISNFFRKYLETDIQPVFDYVIMKTSGTLSSDLQDDELPGDLLKLLHELLNKMHGSVMISEVNKTKYDAIAAGPRLQAQILELTSEVRAAKKSKVFLQKFFWQKNAVHQDGYSLAFNLLVLLAQKRAQLFTKCFIDDIKIVGQIFDEYSLLIVQVVRVLLYQAQDYSHYAQLLPADPIRLLLSEYKIPLEIACEVVRPGVKHIAVMTNEEWKQLTTDFASAYRQCLNDDKYLYKSSRPLCEKWTQLLSNYKEKVLQYIPISFFTAFWFLTLDSIYFPAKSYAQKIDDLKKKLQPNKRGDRANEKQMQRMRTLLDKLSKEQEAQRKKYNDTLSPQNLKKLQVDILFGSADKGRESLFIFAQQFVQTCLLPRMMLDRTQALYCVKFTIEMIKANKMAVTKSIRLLTYIIQYVMGYLPFTTHREASNCISVYLAEILAIFNNWNDSAKLKQDLGRFLGVEEASGKDNYPKLKDYLIKLFQRVGNTLRGVKEEPYLIKNCLYILEKVDSIPSYKEQADQLAQHMNELKELFPTVDMRTSLDRQIAILTAKKNDLPDRPERMEDKKNAQKAQQSKSVALKQPTLVKLTPANAPLIINPITNAPINAPSIATNNPSKKETQTKAPQIKQKPDVRPEEKPVERQIEQKQQQRPKSRFTQRPVDKKPEEPNKNEIIRRPEIKNPMAGSLPSEASRFTDQKVEPKPVYSNPPKTVKQLREQMLRQAGHNTTTITPAPTATNAIINPPIQSSVPQSVQPQSVQLPSIPLTPPLTSSTVAPPPVVPMVSESQHAAKPRQQESKLTVGPTPLRSQRPNSSATIEPTNQMNTKINKQEKIQKEKQEKEKPQKEKQERETQQRERLQKERPQKDKAQRRQGDKSQRRQQNKPQRRQNNQPPKPSQQSKHSPSLSKQKERPQRRENLSPTPQRKKDDRWKDNNYKRQRDFQQRDRDPKDKEARQPREGREGNKDREQGKKGSYMLNRQRKSEQNRKQERRDKSKEKQREKERQNKEREKEKQRQNKEREKNKERTYDKYRRSRSRDKYGRR